MTESPSQERKLPASLILLYPAAFFCPWTDWLLIPGALSYADAFFLASALVLLGGHALQGRPVPISTLMIFTGAALLGIGTLSWIDLGNPATFRECLKLVVATTIVPLVIAWSLSVSERRGVRNLLIAWVLGAGVSALVAALGRRGILIPGLVDPGAGGRAWGLTYHPNSLAYCSSLATTATMYLWLTARGPVARGALGALALLFIYSIQISGSRIAVASTGAALLPFLWHLFTHIQQRFARFALAAGAVLCVGIVVLGILGTIPVADSGTAIGRLLAGGASSEISDYQRQLITDRAWADFYASPLIGSGFQNIRVAHNYFLQIIHAGGMLTAFTFCVWGLGLLVLYLTHRPREYLGTTDPSRQLLFVLIQGLVICWVVVGLKQTLITDRNGYFWVALLLTYGMRLQWAAMGSPAPTGLRASLVAARRASSARTSPSR